MLLVLIRVFTAISKEYFIYYKGTKKLMLSVNTKTGFEGVRERNKREDLTISINFPCQNMLYATFFQCKT